MPRGAFEFLLPDVLASLSTLGAAYPAGQVAGMEKASQINARDMEQQLRALQMMNEQMKLTAPKYFHAPPGSTVFQQRPGQAPEQVTTIPGRDPLVHTFEAAAVQLALNGKPKTQWPNEIREWHDRKLQQGDLQAQRIEEQLRLSSERLDLQKSRQEQQQAEFNKRMDMMAQALAERKREFGIRDTEHKKEFDIREQRLEGKGKAVGSKKTESDKAVDAYLPRFRVLTTYPDREERARQLIEKESQFAPSRRSMLERAYRQVQQEWAEMDRRQLTIRQPHAPAKSAIDEANQYLSGR